MSVISIGRVGLAANKGGDGLVWQAPTQWDQSGDSCVLTGLQPMTVSADLLFWRQQVLALADQTEVAVPVLVPDMPDMDGWYRITSASVPLPGGAALGYKRLPWTISMDRIPDHRAPRFESTMNWATLSNNLGVNGRWSWALRSTVIDTWEVPAVSGATLIAATVETAEGFVTHAYSNATGAFASSGTGRWGDARPDLHYHSSARIEALVSGVWSPVQGLTVPADPYSVRVNNAFTRFAPTPAAKTWTSEVYEGGAWGPSVTYTPWAGAARLTPLSVSVIRNTPERCILRYLLAPDTVISATQSHVTCDVSIRRGFPFVEMVISSSFSAAHKMSANTAGAALLTGAIQRSAADANNNRWVIVSRNAVASTTLTNPAEVLSVSADSWHWALGWGVGGSAVFTATDVRERFFSALSEHVRPVQL